MIENRRLSDKIIIVFLGCLILIIGLRHIEYYNGIIVLNDEFGYWGIAASAAGYNWNDMMSLTPYYGFGYSAILFLFIKMGASVAIAYKIAILANVLMLLASFLLAVYCGHRLFTNINYRIVCIGSFVALCYCNTLFQSQIAWAETYLYFLFWVLCALIISIQKKCTVAKMTMIAVVAGIMFMTHQRTLGILIAIGIILIIMICTKKQITCFQGICFILMAVFMFIIYKNVKSTIQENYWSNSTLGQINDFALTTNSIANSISIAAIINLFEGTGGKAFYFLATGGLAFFIGIKELVFIIVNAIKDWGTLKKLSNNAVVSAFLILSFLSAVGISVLFMLNNYSRLDLAVYGRYIENTIGPILLIGMMTILSRKVNLKELIAYFVLLGISGILTVIFLSKVDSTSFVDVSSVGASVFFKNHNKYEAVCVMGMTAAVVAVLVYCLNNYMKKLGIIFSVCLLCLNWFYTADKVSDEIVLSGQIFREKDNSPISEMLRHCKVRDIYFVQGEDPFAYEIKYFQFWVPDIKIHVISADDFNSIPDNSVWIYENSNEQSWKYEEDAYIVQNEAYTVATQKDSVWALEMQAWEKNYN